ncbi:MAG: glucosamine-6-phosphate deaminase 1 [Sphingobacteriales bacterium]|nr:glucosamine-6-phosphate deaminase 1 [Sphingobacteriales bacterium]
MPRIAQEFQKDKLQTVVFNHEQDTGYAAAIYVTQQLQAAIKINGAANLILATGTSQFSFLEALKSMDIDWEKVTIFHLDEYKGISDQHPASFRKYLRERILNFIKPGKVYLIEGDAENIEEEMENYSRLLKMHPIDVACIGIGENGHIAFNDPPVADFNDPKLIKIAILDENCRNQQLGEGWFPSLDQVPKEAITLTITAIMNCKVISCVVPGDRKAQAVYNTLNAEIGTECPATILRTHPNAILFIDSAAASKLDK